VLYMTNADVEMKQEATIPQLNYTTYQDTNSRLDFEGAGGTSSSSLLRHNSHRLLAPPLPLRWRLCVILSLLSLQRTLPFSGTVHASVGKLQPKFGPLPSPTAKLELVLIIHIHRSVVDHRSSLSLLLLCLPWRLGRWHELLVILDGPLDLNYPISVERTGAHSTRREKTDTSEILLCLG